MDNACGACGREVEDKYFPWYSGSFLIPVTRKGEQVLLCTDCFWGAFSARVPRADSKSSKEIAEIARSEFFALAE